jgi:hypothetical protein
MADFVFTTPNEQHYFVEFENRSLNANEIEDRKIIRRLIEKAIDPKIWKQTSKSMLQGIYLLEEPINYPSGNIRFFWCG